jgi:uncharacterized membrane protein
MTRNTKILLGIATFLPMVLGLMLVFVYISMIPEIIHMVTSSGSGSDIMSGYLSKIFSGKAFALIVLIVLTKFSVLIYYIIDVIKRRLKSDLEKAFWILLFVLFGSIPLIVYYFTKIVPEPETNRSNDVTDL